MVLVSWFFCTMIVMVNFWVDEDQRMDDCGMVCHLPIKYMHFKKNKNKKTNSLVVACPIPVKENSYAALLNTVMLFVVDKVPCC